MGQMGQGRRQQIFPLPKKAAKDSRHTLGRLGYTEKHKLSIEAIQGCREVQTTTKDKQLERMLCGWDVSTKAAGQGQGSQQMDTQMLLMGSIADGSGKTAGRAELRELIASQGYKCALTGVDLEPETAELDHVLAVADGGDHSVSNLQVLHKVVNRMKGSMDNDEFIKWCCLVADRSR